MICALSSLCCGCLLRLCSSATDTPSPALAVLSDSQSPIYDWVLAWRKSYNIEVEMQDDILLKEPEEIDHRLLIVRQHRQEKTETCQVKAKDDDEDPWDWSPKMDDDYDNDNGYSNHGWSSWWGWKGDSWNSWSGWSWNQKDHDHDDDWGYDHVNDNDYDSWGRWSRWGKDHDDLVSIAESEPPMESTASTTTMPLIQPAPLLRTSSVDTPWAPRLRKRKTGCDDDLPAAFKRRMHETGRAYDK